VQLDPGNPELEEAGRDRAIEQVVAEQVLRLEQQMLEVVEELDR